MKIRIQRHTRPDRSEVKDSTNNWLATFTDGAVKILFVRTTPANRFLVLGRAQLIGGSIPRHLPHRPRSLLATSDATRSMVLADRLSTWRYSVNLP